MLPYFKLLKTFLAQCRKWNKNYEELEKAYEDECNTMQQEIDLQKELIKSTEELSNNTEKRNKLLSNKVLCLYDIIENLLNMESKNQNLSIEDKEEINRFKSKLAKWRQFEKKIDDRE